MGPNHDEKGDIMAELQLWKVFQRGSSFYSSWCDFLPNTSASRRRAPEVLKATDYL